jgi:pimeloyl-ACP methyl ester carboxylesterase
MKILLIFLSVSLLCVMLFYVVAGFFMPSNDSGRTKGDRFMVIKGSRIRYSSNDQPGPILIMLHGFGGDHTVWDNLSGNLPSAGIYSLDLLGFGLSEAPAVRYDLTTQSEYVIEFMDRLKIGKAVFVGASMGASIALWIAAHFPERVSGVIAFAPSGIKGSMRHSWPGNFLYRPNIINKMFRFMLAASIYKMLFPRSLALQALNSTAAYDDSFADSLPSITQPVLLIWSREDRRVPFPTNVRYRELIPQAEFLEAPEGAGHSAYIDPTAEITEAIRRFVEKGEQSGKKRNDNNGQRTP